MIVEFDGKKFKSKGELKMYQEYIQRWLTSPDLIIHQEEPLNKYGMSRALRADFLICNKWNVPLAVIEVNGTQHYTDEKVQERDKYKKDWCNENCILYLYGDWNGSTLDFYRWNGVINAADWECMEAFERALKVVDSLGGIEKSIEERKKDREIEKEKYVQYMMDLIDLGWII